MAPVARDSGKREGRRAIGGVRPVVRTMLYLATLHASRCDHTFGTFRRRLQSAGKPVKVALVALNAMLAAGAAYRRMSPS